MKKIIATVLIGGAAVLGLSACGSPPDSNYHGTANAQTPVVSAAPIPAEPVTVTGTGEQVQTAELVATGYTVSYQAESFCLIVSPVETDGSDGISIVNECASDTDGPVTGTTSYKGTGRTTLHVHNTDGPWSLTFTPLS